MTKRTVAIAGGGIAGLSVAIACLQVGWDVTVFEQAPEISEIGAGLQMSPNGVKALVGLGVMERLRDTLYEPDFIEMRDGYTGARVFQMQMRARAGARWGAGYFQIHRADLQAGLLTRAIELGAVVRTDAQVSGYRNEPERAGLVLAGGDVFWADLVVGADGLGSAIRGQMMGGDTPHFTGYYAWRCLVDTSEIDDTSVPQGACVWSMYDQHAITTRVRAGKVINFGAIIRGDQSGAEDWQGIGMTSEALNDLCGAHPVLREIVENTENLRRWPLFERAPLARWSDGRVVVVGDAAHPMLPSLAQGAVQSLEDAVILARMLEKGGDIVAILSQFYALRIARVSRIQSGSKRNMALFHQSNRVAKAAQFSAMRLADRLVPSIYFRQNDWIYGYDPVTAPIG